MGHNDRTEAARSPRPAPVRGRSGLLVRIRRLATLGADGTVVVWDVTERLPGASLLRSSAEFQRAWDLLGKEPPGLARRTVWNLVATGPESVAFLRQRQRPVARPTCHLRQLIADLDSDRLCMRQVAAVALAGLEDEAKPALLQALQERPTLELRRRIEQLLLPLQAPVVRPGNTLRAFRVVEALEHVGSPDARSLLAELAQGEPDARLTCEARAALERLDLHALGRP